MLGKFYSYFHAFLCLSDFLPVSRYYGFFFIRKKCYCKLIEGLNCIVSKSLVIISPMTSVWVSIILFLPLCNILFTKLLQSLSFFYCTSCVLLIFVGFLPISPNSESLEIHDSQLRTLHFSIESSPSVNSHSFRGLRCPLFAKDLPKHVFKPYFTNSRLHISSQECLLDTQL